MWKSQVWFLVLMDLSCDFAIPLPLCLDFLVDPAGILHQMVLDGRMSLMAWRITGDAGKSQDFRNKISPCYAVPGLRRPSKDISLLGARGWVGVCRGIWIPWGQM